MPGFDIIIVYYNNKRKIKGVSINPVCFNCLLEIVVIEFEEKCEKYEKIYYYTIIYVDVGNSGFCRKY